MTMDNDWVVSRARNARDQATDSAVERQKLAGIAKSQRERAREILSASRDAVARNHFAEALAESMRRSGGNNKERNKK